MPLGGEFFILGSRYAAFDLPLVWRHPEQGEGTEPVREGSVLLLDNQAARRAKRKPNKERNSNAAPTNVRFNRHSPRNKKPASEQIPREPLCGCRMTWQGQSFPAVQSGVLLPYIFCISRAMSERPHSGRAESSGCPVLEKNLKYLLTNPCTCGLILLAKKFSLSKLQAS